MLARMRRNGIPHTLLVGMSNGTIPPENNLVIPFKTKTGGNKRKEKKLSVPIVAQRVTNPTCIHKDARLIPGLAQWVKDQALPKATAQVADAAQMWHGCGWLWCRLPAAAPIRHLAWALPICCRCSPKINKHINKINN